MKRRSIFKARSSFQDTSSIQPVSVSYVGCPKCHRDSRCDLFQAGHGCLEGLRVHVLQGHELVRTWGPQTSHLRRLSPPWHLQHPQRDLARWRLRGSRDVPHGRCLAAEATVTASL